MANRYKKIEFKDLSGGSGQINYDEKNPTKFSTSIDLQHDFERGTLRISPDFNSNTISDASPSGEFHSHLTVSSSYNYFISKCHASNLIKVYRRIGFGAYALRFTFPADYTNFIHTFSFQDKIIVFIYNGTLSKYVVAYSTNGGSAWTYTDWDYGNPLGHTITPEGKLYTATYNGEIISTEDGVTWVLEYDGSSATERITSIENLDGFIYVTLLLTSEKTTVFCRVERDELIYIHFVKDNISSPKLETFDNRLYFTSLINSIIYVYEYDKGDVNIIGKIDEETFYDCAILASDDNHLYLVASNDSGDYFSRLVYAVNRRNGIFKVKEFPSIGDPLSIESVFLHKNKLLIYVYNWTDHDSVIYDTSDEDLVFNSGLFETPVVDITSHIPSYLMVKHSKLPEASANDEIIRVYYKIDHASAWTLSLTSNIQNAVSAISKLACAKNATFIQFRVIFINITLSKSAIEDFSLIYFYVPSGLENSK